MPSLEGADAWLDRAEEHLTDLKAICATLTEAEREAMIASLRFNFPDAGDGWAFTQPTQPIPPRASILLGESIQALRRSLDYLIYEIAWQDSGVEQDDTQFPIDHSEQTFERRRQRQSANDHRCYLVGVSDEHAAALKLLQPFKGTSWTKTLGSISNPDKHRHLTVARSQTKSQISGWTLAESKIHEVTRIGPESFTFSWHIVDSSMPDRMHMQFHFTVYIALEDGLRLIETLDNLKAEVANVLADFKPCFGGKCHH